MLVGKKLLFIDNRKFLNKLFAKNLIISLEVCHKQ
jgi:hypothetical protein